MVALAAFDVPAGGGKISRTFKEFHFLEKSAKKMWNLSIALSLVRRESRAEVQPVETVREPDSEMQTRRRHDNAIHGDRQGQ
jgi:hypothetical protein